MTARKKIARKRRGWSKEAGWPKRHPYLTDALRDRLLEGKRTGDARDELIDALLLAATDGGKHQIQALRLIWDRMEGSPPRAVEDRSAVGVGKTIILLSEREATKVKELEAQDEAWERERLQLSSNTNGPPPVGKQT